MDEIKRFLKEYNNELQQSPTSDENVHPKVVSNYCLDAEDVYNQIIDWALYYLENRKCPYQLAVAIAKKTAEEINAGIYEQLLQNNIEQEKLLNSHALYTQTLKKLPTVCKSFSEEMNDGICSYSCSLPYATSAFDIKNKRRTMEDRHVIHHDLNLLLDLKDVPAHSYYAVFDGHSGVDAASYASAHLHVNIAKHPDFLTDTPKAIAQSFQVTDASFLKKCSEENLKSGSTAVCALIREKTVYLSWVGDSQAVLVKGGKPVLVTEPHKPDRQDERKRIEDLGGSVSSFMGVLRVNGMLAITRAFGDPDYKPYISSDPEIARIDLDGTEDFLILACDGLWDELTPEGATAALYKNLSESALDEPMDAAAAKLVHKSKELGSEDNITAIVLFLRDIKTIKDYATELLSQAIPQTSFLGMNGEEKHDSPCVKPTVLELNAASTKKLKNTANVLSSTGFPCPVYSESGFDGSTFQNSDFLPHQSLPSCFAPETTALSELPTPPIDDVVASQQFGNLSSKELFEGLNSISSQQSAFVEDETNTFNSGDFDSMVNIQPLSPVNEALSESHVEKPVASDFTPDEAADIASCVVSNTIETAVKCLSSSELFEPVSPVSTTKLNPFAKPFFPGEILLQSESDVAVKLETVSDVVQSNLEEEKVTENKILETNFSDSKEKVFDFSVKDPFLVQTSETTSVFEELLEINQDSGSKLSSVSTLTSQFAELTILSPQLSCETKTDEDCVFQKRNDDQITNDRTNSPNVLNEVKENEQGCQSLPLESPQSPIKPEIFATNYADIVKKSKSSDGIVEVNLFESISNVLEKDTKIIHSDIIPQSTLSNEASLIVHNDHANLDQIESLELSKNSLTSKVLDLDILDTGVCIGEIVPEHKNLSHGETSKASEDIVNCEVSSNACIITPESENSLKDLDANIQSIEVVSEKEDIINLEVKCISPLKGSDAGITLESVTFESLNLVGINAKSAPTEAILPADSADEGPVEAFAVDLQAIPVGVPEAEGVTEDIDSDSEKDGGWSYMKGNIIGNSGKPKPEEKKEKLEKSTSKPETTSKLRKDTSKVVPDNKIKVRSATATDKVKKPLLEKKLLDVKDKIKPTRTVSSTLSRVKSTIPKETSKPIMTKESGKSTMPKEAGKSTLPKSNVEKLTKPASTFARIKKEVSSTLPGNKVSTIAATKPLRPTTLRNPVATSKPVAPLNKERVLSAAVKTTSNATVRNVRPKSALASNGTKPLSRPPTLPKTQSSNEAKSNVTSARSNAFNRPVAPTVPTRALSKPSTLSKPIATESKVKPSVSTIRKFDSKKPDMKETKDIVNKQISARVVNTITKSEITKSATASNKRTMTLSNKPIPSKTHSALGKTDVNKRDVPKPAMSRLAPKASNLLKSSPKTAQGNKKAPSIQNEAKNTSESAAAVVESSTKITPASEEEKFLLEVNDKEVIQPSKESEKDEVADQKLNCIKNGLAESAKPVEEMVPAANEVEYSAQNL